MAITFEVHSTYKILVNILLQRVFISPNFIANLSIDFFILPDVYGFISAISISILAHCFALIVSLSWVSSTLTNIVRKQFPTVLHVWRESLLKSTECLMYLKMWLSCIFWVRMVLCVSSWNIKIEFHDMVKKKQNFAFFIKTILNV